MKEIDLFCLPCKEYLGSSAFLGTLDFLWVQHIRLDGVHEKVFQWGREVTGQEVYKKELKMMTKRAIVK